MPNSRFALHGKRPSLIHGLCATVLLEFSLSMRLFQAALDTPLDSPFLATLSVHGSHFTVYAPLIGVTSPILSYFRVKMGHFPFKCSVFGVHEGQFGVEKDK